MKMATKKITQSFGLWHDLSPIYGDGSDDYALTNYNRDGKHRSEGYVYLGEVAVDLEVPADFDPRPHQIAELEAQRTEIRAKFESTMTEIARRISKLQAIEAPEAA
jgi:hypothetical protein